ncbi:conjugal transfer protein TraF [Shewanella sp. Isolate11]|uniref:conjugal transfer protein TraF n=1 Tax=Shewanella sp. Isolate11 TaxID=2908530 RepID=UPI001EFD7D6F|nr:conjugal transfer protein TraF [Shewanella sp. Isolate11]MCG9695577.1 conjugal transfer protein TraF [Shewanella sp. Isolate11]
MKLFTALFALLLCVFSVTSSAGQQYYEARSVAMGGSAVAASNREGAAFINPALLAVHAPQYDSSSGLMMLPMIAAEATNLNSFNDKFDDLQDSYDRLDDAISANDSAAIDRYRASLIDDLQGLDGEMGIVGAGLGMSIVIPTEKMPMAIFYKTYIDAIGMTDIAQSDIDTLQNLSTSTRTIPDLDSEGIVVAAGVSELGVALSFPLSIVNMPIAVGISPKFQRVDTYNYAVNANNFDSGDFDNEKYHDDDTSLNLDLGVAMQPSENIIVGLSGRNMISNNVDTVNNFNREFTYHVEPLYTAGVAYEGNSYTLTTDLDLNSNKRFSNETDTQYWRVGGELRPMGWIALRLGYRHDLKDASEDVYSFGTGFSIGNTFNFDLSGLVGSEDTLGGVIQTSYHF